MKNNYKPFQDINQIESIVSNNIDNRVIQNGKKDHQEENNYYLLAEEEILKSKGNSFILLGKTGVGKTSLLNILYGKNVGKVGYSTLSETKKSNYYCIKEKIDNEYIYFSIIDTPGLCDTQGNEADELQKKEIMVLISNESLKIKGLLFLANFQSERLDASEQNTLIDYIKLFPLKDFWKRIIFVFTHYYGDPNSYTKEEIKENNSIYQSEILNKLMVKVNSVCNPIQFNDLNIKYVNMYTRNLNEKKIKNNLDIRKELVEEIIKYIKLSPMFNKLQIFNFENYEIEKNDKYLYNCDLYIYRDSYNKIIHQEFHIHERIPKNLGKDKEHKVQLNTEDCAINEDGIIIKRSTKKEGIKEIFNNYKGEIGGGLTILSLIGAVCSSIFFPPVLPVSLLSMAGGAFIWNKNRVDKEEDRRKTEEIMINEKINELILKELKKFN